MKSYKETKEAIKELVIAHGVYGIYNYMLNELNAQGHSTTNLQNAISYFQYSPKAAKYRKEG